MKLTLPIYRLAGVVLLVSLLAYAGCSSNDEPEPVDCSTTDLAIALTSKSDPADCSTNNGTIVVSATGGAAPYQFSINAGTFGSSGTFNNLGPGSFSVAVKDANNCEKTLSAIVLLAPASPVAGASVIAAHTDCLTPNGSITINVTGGTPPYEYKIGTGAFASTNVFSNLKAGNYTITVQDDANCSITINEAVASNTTISYTTDIAPIIQVNCIKSGCHNGDNGADKNWSVFSNVKEKALAIKARTGDRSMPQDSPNALTQAQIDMIACWVDSGAQNN
ncbi:MAG: SprB repeat-containing protein [Cyclobacteriaceae bacterium]|nr:SprB repeat-containing protein [Cyclobacteriaceae bacterium]